jgi:hypothetical protein
MLIFNLGFIFQIKRTKIFLNINNNIAKNTPKGAKKSNQIAIK